MSTPDLLNTVIFGAGKGILQAKKFFQINLMHSNASTCQLLSKQKDIHLWANVHKNKTFLMRDVRLILTSPGTLTVSASLSPRRCLSICLDLQKQCHLSLKKRSIFISVLLPGEGRVGSLGKMSKIQHKLFRRPQFVISPNRSQDKKENCFFTWRWLQEVEMEVW